MNPTTAPSPYADNLRFIKQRHQVAIAKRYTLTNNVKASKMKIRDLMTELRIRDSLNKGTQVS